MDISFVIPAHNEAAYIASTIDAMHASMEKIGRNYEIVVAADGCTDATVQIAEARGAKVVAHDRRQIAATRNLGARAASGDLLVFIDADTRVTRPALEQMLEHVRRGAVGGGGPVCLDGPLPFHVRVVMPVLLAAFNFAGYTGGAFLFCTRAAFDAFGGWDETYYAGEEIFFARRLKRVGPFRLTRAAVITSGRKLRTFSTREMAALLLRGLVNPSVMKDRTRLGFFYGERRPDPYAPAPDPEHRAQT